MIYQTCTLLNVFFTFIIQYKMYIQNKPQVKSAVNAIIRAKTVGEVPEMYVCASETSYVPRRHRMCLGDIVESYSHTILLKQERHQIEI